jgi:hypothetical protein
LRSRGLAGFGMKLGVPMGMSRCSTKGAIRAVRKASPRLMDAHSLFLTNLPPFFVVAIENGFGVGHDFLVSNPVSLFHKSLPHFGAG